MYSVVGAFLRYMEIETVEPITSKGNYLQEKLMPYMSTKRGEKVAVYKRGADGRPEGKRLGLHDGQEQADRQLSVLRLAASHERKAVSGFEDLDFKPTSSMAKEAPGLRGYCTNPYQRSCTYPGRRYSRTPSVIPPFGQATDPDH